MSASPKPGLHDSAASDNSEFASFESERNTGGARAMIAIAVNTFREAVRNRILYIILIFALLILGSSGIVRDLTISSQDRMVRDLGLFAISVLGLAIAILVGINLVYNELDKKSIYTIVSKPVARWQFLLGKYFGLLLTIYVNIAIMSLFFFAVLNYQEMSQAAISEGGWSSVGAWLAAMVVSVLKSAPNLFGLLTTDATAHINEIIYLIALELAIVTAFAVLYSSFSTPTLSAIFTALTFVAGRLNKDIWAYAQKLVEDDGLTSFGEAIRYYLAMGAATFTPNLGAFQGNTLELNQQDYAGVVWFDLVQSPSFGFYWPHGVLPYCVLYAAAILGVSILIFRGRNFK